MVSRLSKISLALLASYGLLVSEVDARRRRGFVDRRRELQDLSLEEEVGSFGHEQTVILAHEKDSTTAKATSSVHVPHKDATTAQHEITKIEDTWSEEELAEYKRQQEKNLEVKINTVSKDAPIILNDEGEVVLED